jgi:ParB family chromosome partitioning protein
VLLKHHRTDNQLRRLIQPRQQQRHTEKSQRRLVVVRPKGLGKGIESLIPSRPIERSIGEENSAQVDGMGLRSIEIKTISPNPNQPRSYFNEDSLDELSASIKAVGVLQPILVRPLKQVDATTGIAFELIAGERRWRAAQKAGLVLIPALVRETDDVSSVEQALIENLHRQDLTPLEEAAAYQQLLDDFSMTHEQVGERVGKTRTVITNSLRLLLLPPSIQQLLADGRLSGGHARALLGVTDKQIQQQLANQCVTEGWTVRATENEVRARNGRSDKNSKSDDTKKGTTNTTKGISEKLPDPGILELQKMLSEHLATNVQISGVSGRGRVTVEFANYDDLERIYRAMTEGSPSTD